MTTWKWESKALCAMAARGASVGPDLSPVGKGGYVRLVDFRHLLNGEGQTVRNCGDMIDFVKRQYPTLAGLQILVEHLIPADVELPHRLRNRLEELGLVD